jgi:dTDP-4-dehydrorhamnose reductase
MGTVKVVILGKDGLLGKTLLDLFSRHFQTLGLGHRDMELSDPKKVAEKLGALDPEWVIHASGYTSVEAAEKEPEKVRAVNVEGTKKVAEICHALGASLIFFSTDYVFDGSLKRPYREEDPVHPLGEYARSKWEGEEWVRNLLPDTHTIVRSARLFGPKKGNLVQMVVDLGKDNPPLRVEKDQVGSSTYVGDLARATLKILEKNLRGTYHVVNRGFCTWYELARETGRLLGKDPARITPASAAEIGRHAPRPLYSPLDPGRFEQEAGMNLRTWQDALSAYLLGEKPV